MTAFLLSLTAIIAYFMGSLKTSIIASHFVFHCDLRAYNRDNEGITRFRNRFGTVGVVKLLGMEVLKTAIPVIIGGLLMLIRDEATIGRAFALFCLMMGYNFPIMFRFKGETSLVAYAVGLICLNPGVGFVSIIIGGVVYWITRYVSLGAIAGALASYLFAFIALDGDWVHKLVLLCVVIVLIEYRKNIVRLIKGTEPKFTYKKDISYMFDEEY